MAEQKIRAMYCTVCGGRYMGRQFHNQDTGYGLGDCCASFIRTHRPFGEDPMSADEIERTYGSKGYHYEIEGREMTPQEQSKKDKTAYRLHNTPDGHALAKRKRLERSRKYGKSHSNERRFIDRCERQGIIVRPLPKWY